MIRPIIYQVFTRLYGANGKHNKSDGTKKQNGCGKMNDFTSEDLSAIKELGCNYIWYTGLIEHAQKTDYSKYGITPDNPEVVKGRAGSPYAIKDYYDIDPDLAEDVPERLHEFDALVRRTHEAGLRMIIDFVPNHVARQYHSDAKPIGINDLGEDDNNTTRFDPHNNFYYLVGEQLSLQNIIDNQDSVSYRENPAKVTGNDCFSAYPSRNDWYETVKLNYGVDYEHDRHTYFNAVDVPDTWNKMLDILRYWSSRGVDGFRCDMAEMVPCEFWGWVIPKIKSEHKDIIFIAEVYNPWEYRNYIFNGKFDYLYDKVGLYDTLRAVVGGDSASRITQCWQSVDDIQGHMLNFLENHDEQRIASEFFAGSAQKGCPALLVSALMRNNPFMIYFGQELGEEGMNEEGFSGRDGRTTIFDYWTIDKIKRYRNNQLSDSEKSLREFYNKVLSLCNDEPAIREGKFFDLMYANYQNPLMDTNHEYAFLRHTDGQLIIVIANFEDKSVDMGLNIPHHAFDYLSIAPGIYDSVEMLTGEKGRTHLEPDGLINLILPPLSGLVIKVAINH